jgi:hypothetical protein
VDRIGPALAATFLIVGLVLLGILLLAWYGQRAALRPNPIALRRLGRLMVVLGVIQSVVAVAYLIESGSLGPTLWIGLQGALHIFLGVALVRQQRPTT